MKLKMHFKQSLIAVDQLLNALLGGWADETLSARSWRMRNKGKRWHVARLVIDALFWFDKDHCRNAYLSEIYRGHLPVEYRNELEG